MTASDKQSVAQFWGNAGFKIDIHKENICWM